MMRVLIVEGRASSTISLSSADPKRRKPSRKRFAASSAPTTPTTVPRAPRASKFASTLAAPPRWIDSRRTSTTGTGASGEIRVTSPHTNSSSITSPSTTILRSRSAFRISLARILVSIDQNSVDCVDNSIDRHAQDTLRLRKLLAKITVTGLARQLFAHYFRGSFVPRTPVGHVRRSENDDGWSADCCCYVRDAAVVA